MAISKNEFRQSLGRFASGVTVVTTVAADGHLHGITVSAFCSVSLEPPLILVSIEKIAGSHHAFIESKVFAVNVLNENQAKISNHFASHLADKFSGIEYEEGIGGVPILKDCLVNLECRLENAYDGGDHTIFIGHVEKTNILEGKPLLYFQGQYRELK